MTPDFAASAVLASAWWQSQYGVVPDAVVAIDPLVLRALLAAHGPLTLTDGTQLSAEDLVQKVLIDPYLYLARSEEHTSELQSLMRISDAVFCLKIKKKTNKNKRKNIVYS